MYEMRRRFVSPKKIAKEFGKAVRSVTRAVGYISHERGTYGYEAWRREIRAYKQESVRRRHELYSERDRKAKLAAQSAREHLALVELTTSALDSPPRETRAGREVRLEREALSGQVPIRVQASGAGDGHAQGEAGRRAALPRSPAEREARRRARRILQMLGPTARADEIGL
jgi:hypothetical protein